MAEEGATVELYIYDLTNGFASILAPAILGRQVEGVWHTAVVVYDKEFFYGGGGITSCAPGSTQLGPPLRVERLGETFIPYQIFVEYMQGLATTTYTPAAYNLLEHNCNHFSDELAQFLCGAGVAKHIVQQPDELLSGPQRAAVQALLDGLVPSAQTVYANGVRHSRQDSPDYLTLNTQIEEARVASAQLQQQRSSLHDKLARKERRRDKRRRKLRQLGAPDDRDDDAPEPDMAEAEAVPPGPSHAALALEADERRDDELRRRARDPPILFPDLDGAQEFEALTKALEEVDLSPEDRQSLDELQQYIVHGEGSWVLGDDFLEFIGRVLGGACAAARAGVLRVLAAAARRADVALLLHQDRRQHALLNYAQRVDAAPLPEQRALALFMCNLFENVSSSEWLLYISEWEVNGYPLSNIRVTTKVCVHALLSADAALREAGSALLYNVATKEVKTVVFDEVCVELAMAVLQLLQDAPPEELLWRALASLARLAQHSPDVPQLVALVGPDPSAFRGTSQRVDEQIDIIMKTVK